MLFKEIIGSHEIKKQLINSVNYNKVSHAQLFLGNKGCSKLALAFAYAQFLNCSNKLKDDSCGECSHCIKHNSLTHPDLHLIFPVLKVNLDELSCCVLHNESILHKSHLLVCCYNLKTVHMQKQALISSNLYFLKTVVRD